MRRTTQLRRLVARPELDFLMEAHDGLSARIAAEAGFLGVWASGLTISASFGVRDNNELSWSQLVDHVGFMVDDLGRFGCRTVTVVRGYRAEAIDVTGARFVDNADFATTGEGHSLAMAEAALQPGTLLAFGDIVLKRHIVQALLEEAGDGITLSVDSALAGQDVPDRVRGSRPDAGRFTFDPVLLTAIGDLVEAGAGHGGWIGLLHLGTEGAGWLREAIAEARADGTLARARISDLLTRVLARGRALTVVYTRGGWVNVNNLTDLFDASGI